MEVKMKVCPKCENVYNEALHPTCPHCAGAMPETLPTIGNSVVSNIGETQPANGMETMPANILGDIEPVVGWLVCIEGPEKGKDYRLLARINTIGRDQNNDVVLESEQTVSQRDHARVAYDAKHNNYQMIPGSGHNITYVNDMPLYVPQMLNAYDVIEFGETKLLFIPLCTDRFSWKQEVKE